MNRQKPDFYSKKAKKEHYPARSIYKLEEIDKKHSLIKPGNAILDLGSSPGSWLKYCAKKTGPTGRIIAIDRQPLSINLPDNAIFYQADIYDKNLFSLIQNSYNNFHLILSDMAPSTSGIKSVDHQRSLNLAFRAMEIAESFLKKNGAFLCKFFQGADNQLLFQKIKSMFIKTHIEKPSSSRKESFELFVLGIGKKG